MLFDIFILFSVAKCVVKKWICGPSQNCWKWHEKTKLRVRKRWSFCISDLILSRGLQTKTYLFTLSPFCRLYLRSCWWPRARGSADSQEIGVFTFQPRRSCRRCTNVPFNLTLHLSVAREDADILELLPLRQDLSRRGQAALLPSITTASDVEVLTHSYKPPSTHNIEALSIFLPSFLCSGCSDIKIKANDAVVFSPKKEIKKEIPANAFRRHHCA